MLRTGFGLLYSTVGLIQLSTLKVTKFKTKAKNIQSSNKKKQKKKTKTKKKNSRTNFLPSLLNVAGCQNVCSF